MRPALPFRPLAAALAVAGALATSGCAAFRASLSQVDPDERVHFRASFDHSDMRLISQEAAETLRRHPAFAQAENEPPIVIIAGLQNRTTDYVDMKTISDRIRTLMINQGTARFVNESRRAELLAEQGYQAEHATPATQARIGAQLGARYMLTGSLAEMEQRSPNQVRVSRQVIKYYKFTVEVTDLETGLIEATLDTEFARQEGRPLVRW